MAWPPSVFEVDVEEAHFVVARGIGIALVAMHAEKLVVIGESFGAFGLAFLWKRRFVFLSINSA